MSTLIEKLEREYQKWCELEDKSEFGSGKAIDARGRTRGLKDAIEIIKQHSDWISVDERLPPNVTDEEKNYLLLIHKEWGCFIIGQYIKEDDEINSYMGNDPISDFAYWMPIPQPPSEVQP